MPSSSAPTPWGQVTEWVFDLDNTLYPAACDLFAEIDARMTDFVARYLRLSPVEARTLQKRYYAEHGTTLKGMMTLHGMSPEAFLAHVHEVDLSPIMPCERLRESIAQLPGRKLVYTNGSKRHAERVTTHMGLDHLFDGLFGIEDANYHPKPDPQTYDLFCGRFGVEPSKAVFFEDMSRNLKPAHEMGFTTVLVTSDAAWTQHEPDEARPARSGDGLDPHIHYVTQDLTDFLTQAGQKATSQPNTDTTKDAPNA